MAGLLLNKALRIIEPNVHGFAVGTHVSTTDFHDFHVSVKSPSPLASNPWRIGRPCKA
jgi:hypothetical protein